MIICRVEKVGTARSVKILLKGSAPVTTPAHRPPLTKVISAGVTSTTEPSAQSTASVRRQGFRKREGGGATSFLGLQIFSRTYRRASIFLEIDVFQPHVTNYEWETKT